MYEHDPMHMESGHNVHYEVQHDAPVHSKIYWPATAEEESRAAMEDMHFEDRFVDTMQRDHDILAKHDLYADREIRYEDPHFHAQRHEYSDHDPLIGEHRPSDDDFYTYEWA